MRSPTSWASPRGSAPQGRTRQTSHHLLELKRDEIHLWRVDLDRSLDALPALEQTLAPEERAKAGQFRFELNRNRYVAAHGALRTILARYLKTTPGEPVFRYGLHGRPELSNGGLHFSLSHSHDLAVCAISRASHLGVDVEQVRPGVGADLVGCWSPRALRLLQSLPRPARRRALFQGWVRMEAYSKASGKRLDWALETFEVFLDLPIPPLLPPLGNSEQSWSLHDFAPSAGYVGALAAPRGDWSLRYWNWQAAKPGNTTAIDPAQAPTNQSQCIRGKE